MLVVLVVTSFTPLTVKDDAIPTTYYEESQSYDVQSYISWRPSGYGYWTQGSTYSIYNDFDWMVTRSIYPNKNGYYYYDFWFFSQSYYWDGYSASYTSTNLRDVNVYVNGTHITSDYSTVGITFNQTYNAMSLRFISRSTNPKIYFKWGSMKAK